MATEAVKSGAVTNSDASPIVMNTAGFGGLADPRVIDGSATATTGVTSPSTYQMVRVPSNAVLKHLMVKLDAAVTTFTANAGLYYSDGPNNGNMDGTPPHLAGTVVNAGTEFGSAVALAAQVTFLDLCNNVVAANLDKELWAVAGLSSDPGGMFDIVLTTTATNSGAPVVYMEAQIAA